MKPPIFLVTISALAAELMVHLIDGFQLKVNPMFGFQSEHINWCMPVFLGNGELELHQEHGQDDLGLHHGEVLAYAVPRSGREGHEMPARRLSAGEPLRVEFVNIFSP